MISDLKITFFKPDVPGIFHESNRIKFAACFTKDEECGIVLYTPDGTETRLPFSSEGKRGALYGMQIEGSNLTECRYHYYQGDQIFTDPYATAILGLEKWGCISDTFRPTYGGFANEQFDWGNDRSPEIPYADTILYGLNVRAFTAHKSSGVKHKGTFEGVIEKIPYLKELGITAVELMPCYEYEECMSCILAPENGNQQESLHENVSDSVRLNCWGFCQGSYFSPKASYSAGKLPAVSFKSMVKELHQNGLEVMMHFYFPPQTEQMYMLDVLKFWAKEYHVDGFRVSGFHIPIRLIAEDASLKSTKIWIGHLSDEELSVAGDIEYRNFATDNGNFRNTMRRFLKGDEGLINEVLKLHRSNPEENAVINYFADYDGFSLYDCVSYERKHNEANREDNCDGTDINYTWNCGVEGETRKKAVMELRKKQMKNALTFLFLSQGTPFLFSGDEFANTRFGNNNAYCQDNDAGWVKWKHNHFSKEILTYTRFLISLRKSNRVLHMKKPFKVMDSIGCGYPDISYHGTEAWRPDLSYISRMVGIMLCGQYADKDAESLYLVYNMHWEAHRLALPKLPKGYAWVKIIDTLYTQQKDETIGIENYEKDALIEIQARSIAVYQSLQQPKRKSSKRKNHEKSRMNESVETF